MIELLSKLAGFLLDHADLVALVVEAIENGVSKASLMKVIREEMVKASDAEMDRELGK